MLEARAEETLIHCDGRKGTKQTSLSGFVKLMITADVFYVIIAEKQSFQRETLQQGSVHTELMLHQQANMLTVPTAKS